MSKLIRIIHVLHIIGKHRLDELLPHESFFLPLRIFLRLLPSSWFRQADPHLESRLKDVLVELGPLFIKLGQMLSTRPDLLPQGLILELEKLQDRVPPFDDDVARALIESELKQPISTLFARFDRHAMASASIAQVHSAALHTGEEVVVKIVRPGIEKVIRSDLALLFTLTHWIETFFPGLRRFHPHSIVITYSNIVLDELDLGLEASNAARFRRNHKHAKYIYFPDIYWQYCTSRIMVQERIYGVPLTDVATLIKHRVDLDKLSEHGVQVFFSQVFNHNFFHADMHPGNIFVDIRNPDDPSYIAIDCAIAGSLSTQDQSFLAHSLYSFLQQDYQAIAQNMCDHGWVPEDTSVHEFAHALQRAAEPIFERPLNQIDFGPVLLRFYSLARRFHLEAKPQFTLLQKTVLHIEGLGRQLNPALDIWKIGRPLMEKWMKDQLGPKKLLQQIRQNAPALLHELPELPMLIHKTLKEIRDQNYQQRKWMKQQRAIENRRRTDMAFLVAGLIIIGLAFTPTLAFLEPLQLTSPDPKLAAAGMALILLRYFLGGRNT